MFANLLPFRRQPPRHPSELAFVREVAVKRPIRRSRRCETLLVFGWALVALKAGSTFWLVEHYTMPFNPWWIVLPSVLAAGLCTAVYLRRN